MLTVLVVGRVFHRAPSLVKEMKTQLKNRLVDLVFDKIGELVDGGHALAHQIGLPNEVWHYLA